MNEANKESFENFIKDLELLKSNVLAQQESYTEEMVVYHGCVDYFKANFNSLSMQQINELYQYEFLHAEIESHLIAKIPHAKPYPRPMMDLMERIIFQDENSERQIQIVSQLTHEIYEHINSTGRLSELFHKQIKLDYQRPYFAASSDNEQANDFLSHTVTMNFLQVLVATVAQTDSKPSYKSEQQEAVVKANFIFHLVGTNFDTFYENVQQKIGNMEMPSSIFDLALQNKKFRPLLKCAANSLDLLQEKDEKSFALYFLHTGLKEGYDQPWMKKALGNIKHQDLYREALDCVATELKNKRLLKEPMLKMTELLLLESILNNTAANEGLNRKSKI